MGRVAFKYVQAVLILKMIPRPRALSSVMPSELNLESWFSFSKFYMEEFLLLCSGLMIRLVSLELPVQSPVRHSGWRIQIWSLAQGTSICHGCGQKWKKIKKNFFGGRTCGIRRFPGYWSNQSCSCQPISQAHQCWIQVASATYTTAHSNTRSLTHWARPGIGPATSWFLVGFVSAAPRQEL